MRFVIIWGAYYLYFVLTYFARPLFPHIYLACQSATQDLFCKVTRLLLQTENHNQISFGKSSSLCQREYFPILICLIEATSFYGRSKSRLQAEKA